MPINRKRCGIGTKLEFYSDDFVQVNSLGTENVKVISKTTANNTDGKKFRVQIPGSL